VSLETDITEKGSLFLERFRNEFIRYTATGLMLVSLGSVIPGCSKGSNQEAVAFQKKYKNSTPEEAFSSIIDILRNRDLDYLDDLLVGGENSRNIFYEKRGIRAYPIRTSDLSPEELKQMQQALVNTDFEVIESQETRNKDVISVRYKVTETDRDLPLMARSWEDLRFIKTDDGWKLDESSQLLSDLIGSVANTSYIGDKKEKRKPIQKTPQAAGPILNTPEDVVKYFFKSFENGKLKDFEACIHPGRGYFECKDNEGRKATEDFFRATLEKYKSFKSHMNISSVVISERDNLARIFIDIGSPYKGFIEKEYCINLRKTTTENGTMLWKVDFEYVRLQEFYFPHLSQTRPDKKELKKGEASFYSPSDVMKLYVQALNQGDLEKLQTFSTGENLEKMVKAIRELGEDKMKNSVKILLDNYEVDRWGGHVIQDTRARSSAHFRSDDNAKQYIFDFLNVDGIWKVSKLDCYVKNK
jgi:hypothetical protein